MSIFDLYSTYYDLFYHDKDYLAEAKYIDKLVQIHKPGAQTILDLGCGTGRHAYYLSKIGYKVHGVDLSKEMLARAKENETLNKLTFSEGDIRSIRLEERFDVVTSLFHVMSYQVTNNDITAAIKTAFDHLNDNGILIFDCWYGPAVLYQRPEVRIKKIINNEMEITRIAEPVHYQNDNIVLVNYYIFIRDINTNKIEEINEIHKIRYFFKPEIEMMLLNIGFEIIQFNTFLYENEPDQNSWNVMFFAIKKNSK